MEGELLKAFLRLIIFLPLVLLLAYWSIRIGAKKSPWFQGSSQMRLVERTSLGPKTGLCIVKIGSIYYLIGVSEQSVELLKELPEYKEDVASIGMKAWQKRRGQWKNIFGPRVKD